MKLQISRQSIIFIYILFLFITTSSLLGKNPVVVTDELTSISLENSIEYYEDKTNSITIEDMLSEPKFYLLQKQK